MRGLQRKIKAKKESDKERSELRQSRGSRIRDGRIKGGGGGDQEELWNRPRTGDHGSMQRCKGELESRKVVRYL